jgi:hypothetical protein
VSNDSSTEGIPQGQLVGIVSPILFGIAFALLDTSAADRLFGGGDNGLALGMFLIGPVALGTAWYLHRAATETTSKRLRTLMNVVAGLDGIIGVLGIFAVCFVLNAGIS